MKLTLLYYVQTKERVFNFNVVEKVIIYVEYVTTRNFPTS